MNDAASRETYSIMRGGPLRRVESAAHMLREDGRGAARPALAAIAIAYLPVLALGIASRVATGSWPFALAELTIHVRCLVVLPLLFLGERLIETRADDAGAYLLRSAIVPREHAGAHQAVVARTERLRDSALAEAGLLTIALVTLIESSPVTRETVPLLRWSLLPSQLLVRFLILRVLWRWSLWGLYLFRLSRLPLDVRATHPDRLGGLAPLADASVVFGVVVMALSSSAAATWGDRLRFEHVLPTAFTAEAMGYVLVALVVAVAPLWVFTPRLAQMRRRGLHAFGAFSKGYVDALEARCFGRDGKEAFGSPDVVSLNDLGASFDRIDRIRMVIAPLHLIVAVVAGAVLPLVPLAIAQLGPVALVEKLLQAIM